MPPEPHLLFELRNHLFAVPAGPVREVVRLPLLEPLAEAPRHVAGLVNLRGDLVPVVDLAVRMGYAPLPRRLTQALVVLERDDATTAFLVDRVEGIDEIGEEDVEPAPEAPAGVAAVPDALVRRVARAGSRVAMVLDPEDVLYRLRAEDRERPGGELPEHAFAASRGDLPRFRERARRLAEPVDLAEATEAPSLVLVRLGGEAFAVPAASALEFVRLEDVAPVPCCPRHIAGHASLRGDVLVVVDLAVLLDLEPARPTGAHRAMLVPAPAGNAFAILVDDVYDVVEAEGGDGPPEAWARSGYVRGSVRIRDQRVPVLDLQRIATAREIVVKGEA